MQIPPNVWSSYHTIYQYSRTSRYEGILDHDLFLDARKLDYKYVMEKFNHLHGYFKSAGINFDQQ